LFPETEAEKDLPNLLAQLEGDHYVYHENKARSLLEVRKTSWVNHLACPLSWLEKPDADSSVACSACGEVQRKVIYLYLQSSFVLFIHVSFTCIENSDILVFTVYVEG
jgi:hypothetical protein